MNTCRIISLGMVDFRAAYDLQRRLHADVVAGNLSDLLLLLEHPHIYTLGRRGKREHILASEDTLTRLGVETRFTDRGGEVTYHGPGQLVGYPIIDLRRWGGGVRKYVDTLEQVLIDALSECGIAAYNEGKPTGVWVGDAKIAALGVRVSRSVTMHGFALNVCTDLSMFDYIVPCGMPDGRATSIEQELGRQVSMPDVESVVAHAFAGGFGVSLDFSSLAKYESSEVLS